MKSPVFSPIDPPLLLLAFLSLASQPTTRRLLLSRWRAWISADRLQNAETALLEVGHAVSHGGRLEASDDGLDALRQRCGEFSSWHKLFITILPALALGLEPDGAAARRLNRAPVLQALVLAARYGLPVDAARATLPNVTRLLLTLDTPTGAHGLPVVGGNLYANAHTIAGLRSALLNHALMLGDAGMPQARATPAPDVCPEPSSLTAAMRSAGGSEASVGVFVDRVRSVMVEMLPGPLSDSLPISAVFDAYTTTFPGDLTIDAFKSQLLASQRLGKLALRQLDRPEALPEEVRIRSEIVGRRHRFHLVLKD